ncbi:MAG TPA: acyl carrier protein [Azospirillaceae bacterium]|nr:acyl carrier protein [Azospirillaceae bacterium]
MTPDAMLALIREEVARILAEKGEGPAEVGADTRFLGGDLPFDSLDLATLVVALEGRTGRDPFRAGFRQFTTAGELAGLYAAA